MENKLYTLQAPTTRYYINIILTSKKVFFSRTNISSTVYQVMIPVGGL